MESLKILKVFSNKHALHGFGYKHIAWTILLSNTNYDWREMFK